MPRRRPARRRYRRRRRPARRGIRKSAGLSTANTTFSNRPSTVTVRGNSILPEQIMTRLPYADLIQTSTTTTVPGIYVFRVNSIFDPDLSSGGEFPLGRDQLHALYNNYVCFGVSYDITVINMSDTAPARVLVIADTANTSWTTFQEAATQPSASKSVVLGTLDGGRSTARLRGYISVAAVFGVPKKAVSIDDTYKAPFTGNPENTAYMQIVHGNLDGSSLTDVHYEVHLKYHVRVSDLKSLAQTS